MKKFVDWLGDLFVKVRGQKGIVMKSLRRGIIALPFIPLAIICTVLLFIVMPFALLLDKLMDRLENDI